MAQYVVSIKDNNDLTYFDIQVFNSLDEAYNYAENELKLNIEDEQYDTEAYISVLKERLFIDRKPFINYQKAE